MNKGAWVLFLALVWGCLAPARAQEPAEVEAWVAELSGKINAFRQGEDLSVLELDPELCALAQAWAEYLGERGKPEHRANLGALMKDMGYSKMNENLYIAGGFPTVARTMEAWQKSAGHRGNLLNGEIRKLGIGLGRTAEGKTFVVFNGAG